MKNRNLREVNINFINFSRFDMKNLYAVYELWFAEELIYIGCCRLNNVANLPDLGANTEYVQNFSESDEMMISIKYVGDKHHTQNMRGVILRRLNFVPRCNASTTGIQLFDIQCDTDGRIFESQAAASKYYGIHPSALSNHLQRKSGYLTIRRMTFSRVPRGIGTATPED